MTGITGWAHVTLSVRDHDRSVRWYEDTLGFQQVATESDERWTRSVCVHRDSGAVLVLHQHHATASDTATHAHADTHADTHAHAHADADADADGRFDPRRVGLDHLAFAVGDRDALTGWQERLTTLGIPYTPAAETGRGGLAVTFRDPDGIALELFHREPEETPEGSS